MILEDALLFLEYIFRNQKQLADVRKKKQSAENIL